MWSLSGCGRRAPPHTAAAANLVGAGGRPSCFGPPHWAAVTARRQQQRGRSESTSAVAAQRRQHLLVPVPSREHLDRSPVPHWPVPVSL